MSHLKIKFKRAFTFWNGQIFGRELWTFR